MNHILGNHIQDYSTGYIILFFCQ